MTRMPAIRPRMASTTRISIRVMPDRRRMLLVPALDVVLGAFLLVLTGRGDAELDALGRLVAALHRPLGAPGILVPLLVAVVLQVLEARWAHVGRLERPDLVRLLVVLGLELRHVDLGLLEHVPDLRPDEEAHHQGEDRQDDHDLEQRHAELVSPGRPSLTRLRFHALSFTARTCSSA